MFTNGRQGLKVSIQGWCRIDGSAKTHSWNRWKACKLRSFWHYWLGQASFFFLACHASMVTAVTKLRSLHREYIICDEKKRFNAWLWGTYILKGKEGKRRPKFPMKKTLWLNTMHCPRWSLTPCMGHIHRKWEEKNEFSPILTHGRKVL